MFVAAGKTVDLHVSFLFHFARWVSRLRQGYGGQARPAAQSSRVHFY